MNPVKRGPKPQAPVFRTAIPEPHGLEGAELELFHELTHTLKDVLCETDGPALSRYCAMVSLWRDAQAFIETNGAVQETPMFNRSGKPIGVKYRRYPQFDIAIKLDESLLRLEKAFGLSPAARKILRMKPARGEVVKASDKFLRREKKP